ncbi:MAG: tetratricopeptide repeat protein [Candidatus Desantisbacteria bacterium]
MCVGVIAAVCGILQPFGVDLSRWGSDGVPISFFGNPNYTGGYMSMVVFLGIGLLLNSNTKRYIILIGISSLLMYSCLIITKNRGGFLGLLIGLLIFTILNRTEIWKKRKVVSIYGLIIILTTIGLCLHEKTSPLPKLTGTIRVVQSEGKKKIEAAGTFASRIQIWKTTLRVIANNPLLGVGPDALRMASTKYEILEFVQSEGNYNTLIDRAHNEMLDIAAMRGLIGLAVYLWLLSVFFIITIRLWKRMVYPDKWLVSAGIVAIISYMVQNTVGFGVISTSSLFWILIGSIVGIGAKPMGYVFHTVNINRLVRISLLIASILLCVIIIRYSLLAWIADVYYKNGLGLAQRQDIDQAICMYEKALEYNPNEEGYYGELLTAYSNKSNGSREALSMLIKRAEDAVRVNPYHAYYYNILSSAYGESYILYGDAFDRDKAIAACNRAIELKPVFGDPHNNLVAIYVHENKYKEALQEIKKAIKICPEHAEYWRILGELQIQHGLKKNGLFSLEKAIRYNPTMVNVLVSLSRIYFEAGDLLKAEEKMKQAVLLVPDNPRYHRVLGSIYFKQGRFDKATSEFTTALRLSPNDSYLKQMLLSCQQK